MIAELKQDGCKMIAILKLKEMDIVGGIVPDTTRINFEKFRNPFSKFF
jgi:hypothetical protein